MAGLKGEEYMYDYRGEMERRIQQFARYIALMDERTRVLAKRSCFLIFGEKGDDQETSEHYTAVAARAPQPALALAGRPVGTLFGGPELTSIQMLPNADESWDERAPEIRPPWKKERTRFVQFLFRRRLFAMDLPNTTIYPPEARRLYCERSGFVREAEAGVRNSFPEHVEQFDPITKAYIHSDAISAAEDVAYVFFVLWRFPVDSAFCVKASSFRGPYKWERGLLIR